MIKIRGWALHEYHLLSFWLTGEFFKKTRKNNQQEVILKRAKHDSCTSSNIGRLFSLSFGHNEWVNWWGKSVARGLVKAWPAFAMGAWPSRRTLLLGHIHHRIIYNFINTSPFNGKEKNACDKEATTLISINVIIIYGLIIDSSIHRVVIPKSIVYR
jgi:hypothetical protein